MDVNKGENMKATRWYKMGVVFLTLAVNSSLTLAANDFSGIAKPQFPVGKRIPDAGSRRGTAQMKLMLKGLKVNNQNAITSGISIGDNVVAKLEIKNLGTVAGRVKVGYMTSILINARPQFTTNGFVTVAPGQTLPMLLNVRINSRNFDRNINRRAWNPVFRLLTTSNATYRDSYMADNTVVRNGILLKPKQDLAITSIEGVTLKESFRGGGQWDNGTTHPISLTFLIKVKNNASQNSRPTRLSVAVVGKQSANADALRDPRVTRHSIGRCAYWPRCSMKQELSIAAIAAGQTGTFRVQFNNIPHQIVQSKRHHLRVAIGPYICARPQAGVIPGRASINALLRQANVDEAPSFRSNNTLTLTGKFGRGDTCGMENTRLTRR